MRTHLDLFSGIGGFALAARWAGVQTIGFAEIDDYASRVLAKNFSGVPNYGDIRTVPDGLSAWLVTGGFPCQPFSVAGKRGGAADDRWLWPAMAAIIERVRPDWVLAENVPGIVRMELDTVLSDLERLHYAAWPVIVPACAVDAQHRRERVWIVAHTERSGFGGQHGRRARSQFTNGRADVAHANKGDSGWWASQPQWEAQGRIAIDGGGADVPYANGAGLAQRQSIAGDNGQEQPPVIGTCRWKPEPDICRVVDGVPRELDGDRLNEQGDSEKAMAGKWKPEPDTPRVAHGVKNRVDRLRGLGNAIVPQVAYQLIRMMIETETQHE